MITYILLYAFLSGYVSFKICFYTSVNNYRVWAALLILWPVYIALHIMVGRNVRDIFIKR